MIDWKTEWKVLAWGVGIFAVLFWLPVGMPRFDGAVTEALALTRWYAREHVLSVSRAGLLHRRRHRLRSSARRRS